MRRGTLRRRSRVRFAVQQKDDAMKQPHTEKGIEHTDDEQNTGNHKKTGDKEAGGADKLGGTRIGAKNVEPEAPGKK